MKSVFQILLLPAFLILSSCQSQPETATPPVEPTYLNLSSAATYVGIDACKSCHPAQYETFIKAEMGRSFKVATLSKSSANFDVDKPVYDPSTDLHYLPFNKGEDLFIMEYRVSRKDTVHKRVEKIDYIVGSGQHTNSHIMEENGYLYQMPVTWYAQDGKWDLAPKFQGGNNYRFGRPIPKQCMTCHNAMPEFVEGSENRFTKVPQGIDCERCHGPGSIHVQEKQAGNIVDVSSAIDYTIVNPAKLPADRQFDICQSCHMQGATVFKSGKTPFDFRPGRRLSEVQNVFWPRYADSARVFIMASHPDRLKMSSCFRQSQEASSGFQPLTCITCHNVHVSIKELGKDSYNKACQSCHTPERENLCTEEEAVRANSNDNCVTCHMPVSGSEDIPHVRITDHFIRTPTPGEESILSPGDVADIKTFAGLAGLIDTAPSDKDIAAGFVTYYEEVTNHPGFLDSALVYLEKARIDAQADELAPLWIRTWFLQQDYASIIDLSYSLDEQTIEDAWTLYRIGEAFLSTRQPGQAIHYLELAVDRAPEHLRFMNKLAAAYQNDGQLARALSLYDAILASNPKFEDAYNDRGFARVLTRDFDMAEADFLAALELNPNAVSPLGNLASLYYNTDRKAEARPYLQRLLELDPNNPDYLNLWRLLNDEAG